MTIKKMMSYRSIFMGFAMLWVMFFHAEFVFENSIIRGIKNVGYGGVDIFLFASGMGNYFSYFKDEDPLEFLKRRLLRLAPIYVPFIVVWNIYKIAIGQMGPIYFFGNLFGIEGLSNSGKYFNWYLTVLAICYILTPYLAKAVKENDIWKNIFLIIILILVSTAFINDTRFIISYTRLPIYVIGMMAAKYCDKEIKPLAVLSGAVAFLAGCAVLYIGYMKYPDYIWGYGIHWYPFIIMTPFICYSLAIISIAIEKLKAVTFILTALKYIGSISFEMYLVHIVIFSDISLYLKGKEIEISNGMWLIMFAATIPCSVMLHYIAGAIWKFGAGILSRLFRKGIA